VTWIWRKIDAFLGAAVIAASGVAASQAQAFIVQYIQRLGGHLDEASAHLNNVQNGLRYKLMNETVRKELETDAQARVDTLSGAYHAIADTNIFFKPIAFLRHADPAIVSGTWRDFVPSLSASADSIVAIIIAMILGFLIYEVVKLPLVAVAQGAPRKKFRRRG